MFAVLKIAGTSYVVKKAYEVAPQTYNYFASNTKLSDKRKIAIAERRGQLKIEENDSAVVKIVKEELLAYKPNDFTVDDRFLQLEQILDMLDKVKVNNQSNDLLAVCEKIAKDNKDTPGIFKNAFLDRLNKINERVKEQGDIIIPKAKL